jgi:hypothetical protein
MMSIKRMKLTGAAILVSRGMNDLQAAPAAYPYRSASIVASAFGGRLVSFEEVLSVDPISLATVTAALTVLATDAIKGVASSAGKDIWGKVKTLFGWKAEPNLNDLAVAIASRLEKDETLLTQIVTLLKSVGPTESTAAAIVGRVDATKAVIVQRLDVAGDFNM